MFNVSYDLLPNKYNYFLFNQFRVSANPAQGFMD